MFNLFLLKDRFPSLNIDADFIMLNIFYFESIKRTLNFSQNINQMSYLIKHECSIDLRKFLRQRKIRYRYDKKLTLVKKFQLFEKLGFLEIINQNLEDEICFKLTFKALNNYIDLGTLVDTSLIYCVFTEVLKQSNVKPAIDAYLVSFYFLFKKDDNKKWFQEPYITDESWERYRNVRINVYENHRTTS